MKKKEYLELQANEANLPFPEARERFMNRIKEENAEIKQQDKDISEMRKTIDQYNRSVKEIDDDLNNKGGQPGDEQQKYEILYKKEKEINEFMEKYELDKTEYSEKMGHQQETIVALLDHMSKNMARSSKMPNQAQVTDMKDDLKFKQRQLNDAENTAASLQVEVEAR